MWRPSYQESARQVETPKSGRILQCALEIRAIILRVHGDGLGLGSGLSALQPVLRGQCPEEPGVMARPPRDKPGRIFGDGLVGIRQRVDQEGRLRPVSRMTPVEAQPDKIKTAHRVGRSIFIVWSVSEFRRLQGTYPHFPDKIGPSAGLINSGLDTPRASGDRAACDRRSSSLRVW